MSEEKPHLRIMTFPSHVISSMAKQRWRPVYMM